LYILPANVENLIGTSTGDQGVRDNALDNQISMGVGNDLIVADQGGEDVVNGGDGNDFLYFGAAWSSGDQAIGGAGYDTLGLLGSSVITFDSADLSEIEQISVYSGTFDGSGSFNYSLTMHNSNVASGKTLLVTAMSLTATEGLTFNGAAELDGAFTVLGGAGIDSITGGAGKDYLAGEAGTDVLAGGDGNDVLIGGAGADQLTGGGGRDSFRYTSTDDSNRDTGVDLITDFGNVPGERIDLSAIDANSLLGGNQAFSFIGDAAFSSTAGQLRIMKDSNGCFVEGDTNGDGTADFVIQIANGVDILWDTNHFNL
jgi:Ca2+-binding RTX toxin-like protein